MIFDVTNLVHHLSLSGVRMFGEIYLAPLTKDLAHMAIFVHYLFLVFGFFKVAVM
jgi:hypothetical protein